MFKRFKWWAVYLLGFITCGIYTLYTWGKTAKQQNVMAEKSGEKKIMRFLWAVLLGSVTCGIYLIVWVYLFYRQQCKLAAAKNVEIHPADSPFLMLILTCIPLYGFYMLCRNHNALCDVYEN